MWVTYRAVLAVLAPINTHMVAMWLLLVRSWSWRPQELVTRARLCCTERASRRSSRLCSIWAGTGGCSSVGRSRADLGQGQQTLG